MPRTVAEGCCSCACCRQHMASLSDLQSARGPHHWALHTGRPSAGVRDVQPALPDPRGKHADAMPQLEGARRAAQATALLAPHCRRPTLLGKMPIWLLSMRLRSHCKAQHAQHGRGGGGGAEPGLVRGTATGRASCDGCRRVGCEGGPPASQACSPRGMCSCSSWPAGCRLPARRCARPCAWCRGPCQCVLQGRGCVRKGGGAGQTSRVRSVAGAAPVAAAVVPVRPPARPDPRGGRQANMATCARTEEGAKHDAGEDHGDHDGHHVLQVNVARF